MPLSVSPKLGGGSCARYENPSNPGVFVDLRPCLTFGGVGTTAGSSVDVSPICEESQITIPGDNEAITGQMTFNDVDDTEYETFLGLVTAKTTLNMQFEWSNGRTATVARAFSGRSIGDPNRTTQIIKSVDFSQAGDPDWGVAA